MGELMPIRPAFEFASWVSPQFKLYLLKEFQRLKEEEQKQLPSDTDVTITAYEIFNDRDLSQDVTAVIFDILEAVKLDDAP